MRVPSNALALSHAAIRFLIILNLFYLGALLVFFAISLALDDIVFEALGVREGDHRPSLVVGMRTMMIVGAIAAGVVDRVLRQLQAIVDTVRVGDPFVADNARRLQAMAWWILAGECLRLVIGAIAWGASTPAQSLDVTIEFSLAPWLAVLLLFVLSRVFDEGTRMRSDLAGTV